MVTVTMGAALVSAAMVSAQGSAQSGSADGTVVYRGCLSTGAGQGNFILSKATEKGQKSKDKISLKVTAASDKVKLETFLLREVEITGTLGTPTNGNPTLSEGGEVLRTLTATKITWRADYCG
jgi:hypothetical protein